MSDTGRWLAGASVLLGAWVFVSAFLFNVPDAQFWNNVIVGVAIVIIAGYSGYQAMERTPNRWAAGLAALLGLWMIITPFIYEGVEMGTTIYWSDIVAGVLVAILSGYNSYQAEDVEDVTEAERERETM